MKMLSTILLSVVALSSCTNVPDAVVDIVAGGDQISGRLEVFKQHGRVAIKGTVKGLTQGLHGFHVHEKGDLGNGCKAAGGHFNPFGMNHGGPDDRDRHVGDLGNIEAGHDGVAHVSIEDRLISLDPSSGAYIGGLAIVIHAGTDDLGRGGDDGSLSTGNAGSRSGCGVIRHLHQHQQPQLVHQQPQPVHQHPQPVHQHPQPVHQQPQPVHQHRQPVHQQPQPVHQQPQPVHQQPQPVHQLPQPVHHRPISFDQYRPPVTHHNFRPVFPPQPYWSVHDW